MSRILNGSKSCFAVESKQGAHALLFKAILANQMHILSLPVPGYIKCSHHMHPDHGFSILGTILLTIIYEQADPFTCILEPFA